MLLCVFLDLFRGVKRHGEDWSPFVRIGLFVWHLGVVEAELVDTFSASHYIGDPVFLADLKFKLISFAVGDDELTAFQLEGSVDAKRHLNEVFFEPVLFHERL